MTNADVDSLQPTSEFVRPKKVKVRKFGKNIVPGIEWKQTSRMTLEVKHELENYSLSPVLTKVLNQGEIILWYTDCDFFVISSQNYTELTV